MITHVDSQVKILGTLRIHRAFPWYDMILRLNRRLMVEGGKIPSILPLTFSHAMAELFDNEGISARDISRKIVIDKSTLSRELRNLENVGFIKLKADLRDYRVKLLTLTAKGNRALLEDLERRNQQMKETFKGLNSKERKRTAFFFKALADGSACPILNIISGEEEIEIQLRRLTRGLGALGNNFLGCGEAIESCQILHLISSGGEKLNFSDLNSILPYATDKVSRLVSKLEREGLLKKEVDKKDKRGRFLTLTAKGERYNRQISNCSETLLVRALSSISQEDRNEFLSLLSKPLMGEVGKEASKITLQKGVNPEDFFSARAFLVQHLLDSDLHHRLEETIISENSFVLIARQGGEVVGILEASSPGDKITVTQLAGVSPGIVLELIRNWISQNITGQMQSSIEFKWPSAAAILKDYKEGDSVNLPSAKLLALVEKNILLN